MTAVNATGRDVRDQDTWPECLRGTTHMLVVPQGFTLSIAGVLGISIGHHGYPGPVAIWLFVVGAGGAFVALTVASGAHRVPANRPVSIVGVALLNVVPMAVVPIAGAASWWIANDAAAFSAAGVLSSALYLVLTAGFVAAVDRLRRKPRVLRPGER